MNHHHHHHSSEPHHHAQCRKPLWHSAFLDRFGMSASFLCAIHCAFAPLLIPLMAAFGFGFLWSHEFETGMIGLSLVVGGWSLTSSYVKVHRNWVPYVFLAAGIALIALTRFVFPEDWELIGLPSGAILIVIAHWLNYRLVQREHLACG